MTTIEPESTRFLQSGDERAPHPATGNFRPDVEGLRAIAVLPFVLYHAGVPRLTGGFVGVDVFFVISGFVITGLPLGSEQPLARLAYTGSTDVGVGEYFRQRLWSLSLQFSRPITGWALLPVTTQLRLPEQQRCSLQTSTSYQSGRAISDLSCLPPHFKTIGRSPSKNNFHVVYPTLFVLAALLFKRITLRRKLEVLLVVSILASFVWSVHQTSTNATAAYFSPFTCAWELGLGALVAVGSPRLAGPPFHRCFHDLGWFDRHFRGSVPVQRVYRIPGFSCGTSRDRDCACRGRGEGSSKSWWGACCLLRLPPLKWLGKALVLSLSVALADSVSPLST